MTKIKSLLKQAEEHFDDGEYALQTVFGQYETTVLGTESIRGGIFIATNQRLLFYAKKFIGYEIESFLYKNISSLEMGKNLLGHYVSFFASGNSAKMKWISDGDTRAFVDAVKTQMESEKSSSAQVPEQQPNPIEQLKRLGQLHADGILTDNEFTSKKAEILKRL